MGDEWWGKHSLLCHAGSDDWGASVDWKKSWFRWRDEYEFVFKDAIWSQKKDMLQSQNIEKETVFQSKMPLCVCSSVVVETYCWAVLLEVQRIFKVMVWQPKIHKNGHQLTKTVVVFFFFWMKWIILKLLLICYKESSQCLAGPLIPLDTHPQWLIFWDAWVSILCWFRGRIIRWKSILARRKILSLCGDRTGVSHRSK